MTNTPSTPSPPPDAPPRRLALLGCLLPIAAVALFLLVLFAWPGTSRDKASDLRTVLFFVSLALVPVAALAAVVLAALSLHRANRQFGRKTGVARGVPLAGTIAGAAGVVVVAIVCIGVVALVVWAALQGLAGFR